MLRPMLTELHRLDLGTFQTLEGKQLIRKKHGFFENSTWGVFSLYFVCSVVFVNGAILWSQFEQTPGSWRGVRLWMTCCSGSGINWHRQRNRCRTPEGFPGGDAWNSAIWSSRYVEVYNTNAMDERWKRSVNLETRDFAACYSGSLYEYIDIDHGAD